MDLEHKKRLNELEKKGMGLKRMNCKTENELEAKG